MIATLNKATRAAILTRVKADKEVRQERVVGIRETRDSRQAQIAEVSRVNKATCPIVTVNKVNRVICQTVTVSKASKKKLLQVWTLHRMTMTRIVSKQNTKVQTATRTQTAE